MCQKAIASYIETPFQKGAKKGPAVRNVDDWSFQRVEKVFSPR
jgi:hypothetical protein